MHTEESLTETLASQLSLMAAAASVLAESQSRVTVFKDLLTADDTASLSAGQRESCEALTSRFARLNDFLVQRMFRTIDRLELIDDSSVIDRLERAEARGLIDSAERWRQLRMLRNEIAHDYLIEAADRVLHEALEASTELLQTAGRVQAYVREKGYCK